MSKKQPLRRSPCNTIFHIQTSAEERHISQLSISILPGLTSNILIKEPGFGNKSKPFVLPGLSVKIPNPWYCLNIRFIFKRISKLLVKRRHFNFPEITIFNVHVFQRDKEKKSSQILSIVSHVMASKPLHNQFLFLSWEHVLFWWHFYLLF